MKVSFCRLKSEKQEIDQKRIQNPDNIVLNKKIFRGIYITKYLFFFFFFSNIKSQIKHLFLPKDDTITRKVNAAKLMNLLLLLILYY